MTVGQTRTNAAEEFKDAYLLEPAKSKGRKSFRRYAEYKDSGVEWLGNIPIDWQVSLIKRRYEVTLGKMLKSNQTEPDETEESYLRAANIHWRDVDIAILNHSQGDPQMDADRRRIVETRRSTDRIV